MNEGAAGQPNQNVQVEPAYSKEYVSSLREEAATWRTKLRETEEKVKSLEGKYTLDSVSKVLTAKGIKADASWVKLDQGQSPEQAVDKFLELYPHLKTEEPKKKEATNKPNPTKKDNTNSDNRFVANQDLDAIKQDPIARSKLRDTYRALLVARNQQVV